MIKNILPEIIALFNAFSLNMIINFMDKKMRLLLIVLSFFIINCACADEVRCYTNGQQVYHGFVEETVYSEELNVLWFVEPKTHNFVFIEGMDCIVKLKMKN